MGTSLYPGSKKDHFKPGKTIAPFSSVLSHDSQMRQYYNEKSSTSEVATTKTDSPSKLALVSEAKPAPMRFKISDSIYNKKSTHNKLTVEAKFQRYTSGSTSSETDILQFWEVRYN